MPSTVPGGEDEQGGQSWGRTGEGLLGVSPGLCAEGPARGQGSRGEQAEAGV